MASYHPNLCKVNVYNPQGEIVASGEHVGDVRDCEDYTSAICRDVVAILTELHQKGLLKEPLTAWADEV